MIKKFQMKEQKSPSYMNIRTCAILMTDFTIPTGMSRLEFYLNAGNFVWFLGEENSHIVYNISKKEMLHIGDTYGKDRIIWMDNTTLGGIKYELWKKGRCSQLSIQDRVISEETLAMHNDILGRIVEKNTNDHGYDRTWVSDRIIHLTDDTLSGRCLYESRGRLYGGYQRLPNNQIGRK